MKKEIFLASDHAAYHEKEALKSFISLLGTYEVKDLGPLSDERCNYSDYAIKVARSVQDKKALGILLCGSGIGVSMVANRFKDVRAALCRSEEDAKLSRQHNDANIICFGARVSSIDQIKSMLEVWLNTEFEAGRHSERIEIFNLLGQ